MKYHFGAKSGKTTPTETKQFPCRLHAAGNCHFGEQCIFGLDNVKGKANGAPAIVKGEAKAKAKAKAEPSDA